MADTDTQTDPTDPPPSPPPGRPRAIRRALASGASLALAGVLLALTLGELGRHHWALDLFAHFRIQYALALASLTVLLFALAAWRRALLALVCALALTSTFRPYLAVKRAPPMAPITIVHFNVLTSNTAHAPVLDYLASHDADLICLQEVNAAWMAAVRARPEWELVVSAAREDNFGIALLRPLASDVRIEHAQLVDLTPSAGVPAIEARIAMPAYAGGPPTDRRAMILFVHTLPPLSARYARTRDAMLDAVAQWAIAQPEPAMVIGDLNATPWSAPFRRTLHAGGLTDSMTGIGLAPSWPARLPTLCRIPIDHCLTSPHWRTVELELGPDLGSDHRPLSVRAGLLDTAGPSTPPDPPGPAPPD